MAQPRAHPRQALTRLVFTVVTSYNTHVSGRLPSHFSAQAAELVALIEACKKAKGRTVNIYTDSHYAFGVVHDFGTLMETQRVSDFCRQTDRTSYTCFSPS